MLGPAERRENHKEFLLFSGSRLFLLTGQMSRCYTGKSGKFPVGFRLDAVGKRSTSLGEGTTQTQAEKPGDGPTGGAGVAGLRLCPLFRSTGHYVVWSQSSHQEV